MNFLSAQIGDLRSGKLSHPFAIGLLNSELCFVIAHLPPSHRRCNLNPALRTAFQLSLLRAARVVTIVALVLRSQNERLGPAKHAIRRAEGIFGNFGR